MWSLICAGQLLLGMGSTLGGGDDVPRVTPLEKTNFTDIMAVWVVMPDQHINPNHVENNTWLIII